MSSPAEMLEQIYRDTAPSLVAYFRRRPGLSSVAEDLTQDTFVRALRRCDRLASSISPRAYLFGIARHVAVDFLRRRDGIEHPVDPALVADDGPHEDPRLESLRATINRLPELHREPLLLKLQQGLSYAEIGEILGLPEGTVRSRLHYAVARLKEQLNPPASTRGPATHPDPILR